LTTALYVATRPVFVACVFQLYMCAAVYAICRSSIIPRLHDEAGSTSWLYERSSSQFVEPASSCKRGITGDQREAQSAGVCRRHGPASPSVGPL